MKKIIRQLIEFSDGTSVDMYPPMRYWRHKRDHEIMGRIRGCATPTGASPNTTGCPAVWTMLDEENTIINKYWQFALCAWNPGIAPRSVMAELNNWRALANSTGFGDKNPPRKNYVTGENLNEPNAEDPAFDKDRTMSNSMLSGEVRRDIELLFKDYRSESGKKIYRGVLLVNTLNGNYNPPIKPGLAQPERVADAKFDMYKYNPRDNWDLFYALNIINFSGDLVPFAGGATYPWYFNGRKPVCFMPHVSRRKIAYPLDLLEELPVGTPRISPYTK